MVVEMFSLLHTVAHKSSYSSNNAFSWVFQLNLSRTALRPFLPIFTASLGFPSTYSIASFISPILSGSTNTTLVLVDDSFPKNVIGADYR